MAKPQRKALARLERRRKAFDAIGSSKTGKSKSGYKRPGSLNRKKS